MLPLVGPTDVSTLLWAAEGMVGRVTRCHTYSTWHRRCLKSSQSEYTLHGDHCVGGGEGGRGGGIDRCAVPDEMSKVVKLYVGATGYTGGIFADRRETETFSSSVTV